MVEKSVEQDRLNKSQDAPCEFFIRPVYNRDKSAERNAPVYDFKAFARIETGTDGVSDIKEYPVSPELKKIYSRAWRQFQDFEFPQVLSGNLDLDLSSFADQFPAEFAAYKTRIRDLLNLESATLIEELGIMPASWVMRLKSYGIFCMEQLDGITEPDEIVGAEALDCIRKYKIAAENGRDISELCDMVIKLTNALEYERSENKRLKAEAKEHETV
jgi:hypothetical protein